MPPKHALMMSAPVNCCINKRKDQKSIKKLLNKYTDISLINILPGI